MKTKEEVIKEAYGNFYEPNKYLICLKKGWVTKYIARRMQEKGLSMSECPTKHDCFLPSSIEYLNTNNGWIKLTGVEKEIPDNTGEIILFNIETKEEYISTSDKDYIEVGRFTHYQPIVKPKPPLY